MFDIVRDICISSHGSYFLGEWQVMPNDYLYLSAFGILLSNTLAKSTPFVIINNLVEKRGKHFENVRDIKEEEEEEKVILRDIITYTTTSTTATAAAKIIIKEEQQAIKLSPAALSSVLIPPVSSFVVPKKQKESRIKKVEKVKNAKGTFKLQSTNVDESILPCFDFRDCEL